MNNFNFKNAICTNMAQSNQLISIGINPLTADMYHENIMDDAEYYQSKVIEPWMDIEATVELYVPAWSFSRINEMMPTIEGISGTMYDVLLEKTDVGHKIYYADFPDSIIMSTRYYDNLFDAYIDMMNWTIKEGFFNKDYLVNVKK